VASPLTRKGWTVSLRSLGDSRGFPAFPRYACARRVIPLPGYRPQFALSPPDFASGQKSMDAIAFGSIKKKGIST
jgi:hypothetical protein